MNLKNLIVSTLIATGVLTGLEKLNAKLTTTPEPKANEVWIQVGEPNPAFITVPVNTTIKWANMDNATHSVASISGLFNSGGLTPGDTYSFKFTAPGIYFYHCPNHSHMTGEVIVR